MMITDGIWNTHLIVQSSLESEGCLMVVMMVQSGLAHSMTLKRVSSLW